MCGLTDVTDNGIEFLLQVLTRLFRLSILLLIQSERDVSVRQRAVNLLYAMCDRTNAQAIVGEMLSYLEIADYSIREEMVLKVAILAEKYATDYSWYVDTILNLIRVAGDYVSEEVWHRVIQIVVNREDIQGYAAKTVFEASVFVVVVDTVHVFPTSKPVGSDLTPTSRCYYPFAFYGTLFINPSTFITARGITAIRIVPIVHTDICVAACFAAFEKFSNGFEISTW